MSALAGLKVPHAASAVSCTNASAHQQTQAVLGRLKCIQRMHKAPDADANTFSSASMSMQVTLPRCPAQPAPVAAESFMRVLQPQGLHFCDMTALHCIRARRPDARSRLLLCRVLQANAAPVRQCLHVASGTSQTRTRASVEPVTSSAPPAAAARHVTRPSCALNCVVLTGSAAETVCKWAVQSRLAEARLSDDNQSTDVTYMV